MAFRKPRRAQQFNGREGETATFLSNLSVKLGVACNRFRPTSSQSLAGSWCLCYEEKQYETFHLYCPMFNSIYGLSG